MQRAPAATADPPATAGRPPGLPANAAFTPGAETPEAEAAADYRTGSDLARAGRYDEALPYLRRVAGMAEAPLALRGQAMFDMATCYEQLGQTDKAIALYEEYLLVPDATARPEALESLRRLRARAAGRDPAAGAPPANLTPEQVAAADEQAEAEIAAGDALGRAGDFPGALAHHQTAYELGAASPRLRARAAGRCGLDYTRSGNFAAALNILQEALSFPAEAYDPDDRAQLLEWMRQARTGQRGREAPQAAMTPEQQQARFDAALALGQAGQYAAALAGFQEVYAQRDADPALRGQCAAKMGFSYQMLGDYDQAISLYEEALQFPDLTSEQRERTLERIREARLREAGPHIRARDPAQPNPASGATPEFEAELFFSTGSVAIAGVSANTVSELTNLLERRHQTEPDLLFTVWLTGHTSARWQGARTREEAKQRNAELAEARARGVEQALLARLQPPTYTMVPTTGADPQQEEAETDSKDNSWFARAVTVQVYAARVTPP